MACFECKDYIETDYTFCPRCGLILDKRTPAEKFRDLLAKTFFSEVSQTIIICENKKKISIKKKDYDILARMKLIQNIVRNDIEYIPIHRGYQTKQHLDHRGITTVTPANILDKTYTEKFPLLDELKIPYITTLYGGDKCDLGVILCRLIKNRISNPFCALSLGMILDTKSADISNMVDRNQSIEFALFDDYQIHNSDYETDKKEAFDEFDKALDSIKTEIYYSNKHDKIYQRDELMKLLDVEMKVFDFELEDHCEKFNVKHINVFILNKEIDEMFFFVEMRQNMKKITDKIKIKRNLKPENALFELVSGFKEI